MKIDQGKRECVGGRPWKSKNSKNQQKYKKCFFSIFVSFLAFSTSSKKKFKFSKKFWTRSTCHTSFLKSLIFLIESTLILLVFKKIQKIKKKQNLQKTKVEGPILRLKQHFTYKYRSIAHTKRGGQFWKKNIKKTQTLNLNLSLSKPKPPPPSLAFSLRRPALLQTTTTISTSPKTNTSLFCPHISPDQRHFLLPLPEHLVPSAHQLFLHNPRTDLPPSPPTFSFTSSSPQHCHRPPP